LKHILQGPDSDKIDIGIDLQDYYLSVEWDIMKVPAVRNEKFYSCCEEPYPDIIFNITLRRKTLFYTVSIPSKDSPILLEFLSQPGGDRRRPHLSWRR
jgi:Neurotransmitter-gated ion-channel ligand binding domain.